MENIVYIHGANSSPRSFKHIQNNLPRHNILNIEYSIDTPLIENVEKIKHAITNEFPLESVSIISHSLGGLIAMKLHDYQKVNKIVTMSAPFGGSKFIKYLKWICPNYQIFSDIKPNSKVIKGIKKSSYTKPILSIVTSAGGNPLMGEENDGTVTVASQLSAIGPLFEKYDLSHFEVLLSDRVIKRINQFLF